MDPFPVRKREREREREPGSVAPLYIHCVLLQNDQNKKVLCQKTSHVFKE